MLYVLILAIAATAASIVHMSTLHIPEDGVAAGDGEPAAVRALRTAPAAVPDPETQPA